MQESHKDKNAMGRVSHTTVRGTGCKWEKTEIETSDIETWEQFKRDDEEEQSYPGHHNRLSGWGEGGREKYKTPE